MEIIKRVLGFHKTPPVLVEACLYELECVVHDVSPPKGRRLNKRFFQMKNFLFGKGDSNPEVNECEELAKEIIANKVILKVLIAFSKLTQQERSSFTQVFTALITRDHYHFASSYMVSQEGDDILHCIINNFARYDLSAHCGLLLQECMNNRYIHNHFLESNTLLKPLFTQYACSVHFDISSDVMQIIYSLLRNYKQQVLNVMKEENEISRNVIIDLWMRNLISCSNYITVRMALKLLSDFLSDPLNIPILKRFLTDERNLVVIMNLLTSPYSSIQIYAFSIFKLFVANPRNTPIVNQIFLINRDYLLTFFMQFLPQNNDEVFIHEKKVVISMLSSMA